MTRSPTGSSKIDLVTCLGWKVLHPKAANEVLRKKDKKWKIDVQRVRLSDALILPVLGTFGKAEARIKFTNDFDSRGRLRSTRAPEGDTPVVRCFGVDWFIRVDGRLLCGKKFYDVFGWDIAESQGKKMTIRVGEFAANQAAVDAAKRANIHYKMIGITTEEDVYDKVLQQPDVVDMNYVLLVIDAVSGTTAGKPQNEAEPFLV